MRVNVSVAEKSEEMQRGIVVFDVSDHLFPGVGSKHFAAFDGLTDQFCALSENLTGAECVVTDLGVSHIVVGGKSDSGAVRFEFKHRIVCRKHIERGRVGKFYGVSGVIGSDSHAVHYYSEDRSFDV